MVSLPTKLDCIGHPDMCHNSFDRYDHRNIKLKRDSYDQLMGGVTVDVRLQL